MAWNGSVTRNDDASGGFENESSTGRLGATPVKRGMRHGLVAGLIVALGGAIVGWLIVSGRSSSTEPALSKSKPHHQISEATPEIPVREVSEEIKKPVKPVKPKSAGLRDKRLTPEQRETLYEKQLQEVKLQKDQPTNMLFRSGTEQVMGWIFSTQLGDMPPPLPRISDFDYVHMQEILETQNTLTENDTERSAEIKQTVDFAKQELKKFLDKGGDPDEFLEYYRDELREAYQKRQDAYNQVLLLLKEEPDSALEYVDIVNKSLKEQGIKEIEVAPRTLARYGIVAPEKSTNQQGR